MGGCVRVRVCVCGSVCVCVCVCVRVRVCRPRVVLSVVGRVLAASARLVPGRPACSVLAVDADGRKVTTVEGLAEDDRLHPLQEAFMKFGALQCGYCTSGILLTAKAMLDENSHPDDEQIKSFMGGSFCRCGCYQEIMQAIRSVVRA